MPSYQRWGTLVHSPVLSCMHQPTMAASPSGIWDMNKGSNSVYSWSSTSKLTQPLAKPTKSSSNNTSYTLALTIWYLRNWCYTMECCPLDGQYPKVPAPYQRTNYSKNPWIPQPHCQNDCTIMEDIQAYHFPYHKAIQLNSVRLFLWINCLSKITDHTRTWLLLYALHPPQPHKPLLTLTKAH